MNTIIPANVNQIAIPRFSQTVQADWFNSTVKTPRVLKPDAKAVAYHIYITRHSEKVKMTWTDFNKSYSDHITEKTSVGFLTNNSSTCTWHWHYQHICCQICSYSTVTWTETLCCDSRWGLISIFDEIKMVQTRVNNYVLIPRIGGLHTAINFLRAIGQHMESSGLVDVWVESGLLGPNASVQVISGKKYARAVRFHKLTVQALW